MVHHSHPNLVSLKGLSCCIVDFKSACCLLCLCRWCEFHKCIPHLMWLLRSSLGLHRHTFLNLKPRRQVKGICVLYQCTKKEPQKLTEHTSEQVNLKFSGGVPAPRALLHNHLPCPPQILSAALHATHVTMQHWSNYTSHQHAYTITTLKHWLLDCGTIHTDLQSYLTSGSEHPPQTQSNTPMIKFTNNGSNCISAQ